MSDVNLPMINQHNTEDLVSSITQSLNFPRNVLAEQYDIETVWGTLGRELGMIKTEYKHELLARMVIAIRVGLFSSAVNEIWNTSVLAIKKKIIAFGLHEAGQLLGRDLSEKKFKELTDKDLLDISIELGLFDERAYFFLDNCREIRNNYSSAHPSESMLDGTELNYVIHQCVKHVLSSDLQFIGLKTSEYISAIKNNKLDDEGLKVLSEKLKNTNEKQKNALMKTIFGIYVDESEGQVAKDNCLAIAKANWEYLSEEIIADILSLYSSYLILSDNKKDYAKRFFEKIKVLDILPENEYFSIVSKAIKQLESAHHGMDNFYIEPAFAERVYDFSSKIPSKLKKEYVSVVSMCFIGNPYGTSISAEEYYKKMIRNFNVEEVDKLFQILSEENYISKRIKNNQRCKNKLKELLSIISSEAVPINWKREYEKNK